MKPNFCKSVNFKKNTRLILDGLSGKKVKPQYRFNRGRTKNYRGMKITKDKTLIF